jgi:1-hydroxy-2-naphthoate dioxygenase
MSTKQSIDSLEALALDLDAANMRGQWQNESNRRNAGAWTDDIWTPSARGQPWLWRAKEVRSFLDRSAKVLPETKDSRRSIVFNNPALPRGSIETINMGVQMILPGELAWAHRHSISALRFVIQGHPGLVTVVDGIALPMETGDLVLTPSGDWHDHFNGSDQPALWLDVLDGPVINAINQTVFQTCGDRRQALRNSPAGADATDIQMRFRWAVVQADLAARPDEALSPVSGHVFDYLDPNTGEHPMRTLGCRMRRLPAGFIGRPYRSRVNAVFHAFKGGGHVIVDGNRIDWTQGDCFVVPGWSIRSFAASPDEDCFVFETHDAPLLENLGLLQKGLLSSLE